MSAVAEDVLEYVEWVRTHGLQFFKPIKWQKKFHAMGAKYPHRMVSAANQTGKTSGGGGYEFCLHLLGEYPEDWEGAFFKHPPLAWCAGVNLPQIAEVTQKVIFGERVGDKFDGSGFVPPENIESVKWSRQTPDTANEVKIKGRNGTATCRFKAYSSTGAEKKKAQAIAGTTCLDLLLVDEQPPSVALGQMITRTLHGKHCTRVNGVIVERKGGLAMVLYTPELGADEIYKKFSQDPAPTQGFMNVTWDDVEEHVLSMEQREATLASIPPHEHEMRSKGIPMLGGSVVFPVEEKSIKIDPFHIPSHWLQLIGIDFGINHPFAAAKVAYDPDEDIIYVTSGYRERNATPPIHCSNLRTLGAKEGLPVIYPHDGDTREKGSGTQLISFYQDEGIENVLRFTNEDGSIYREPGILDMLNRMKTGRFKVFSSVDYFFEEMRLYHRKNGQIVDLNDDFISATRYAAMTVGRYGVQAGRVSAFEDDLADYYRRIS